MTLGGQREVRGGQRRVRGGRRRPIFFFHLVRFKIMGLCGGFSLLLKRPELMLNEFSMIFFWKVHFFWFFRVLYIRKFREFFTMVFTIKKSIFYERGVGNWNLE